MRKSMKKNPEEAVQMAAEDHLDVYARRSVLHVGDTILTFQEGAQSAATKKRYRRICDAFKSGYLVKVLQDVQSGKVDLSLMPDLDAKLLKQIVDGVSENEGRAVACICFLQLAIKSIELEQSVRLHKGGPAGRGFSWVEGISMRSLDSKYASKFLRDNHLMSINSFGAMMTKTSIYLMSFDEWSRFQSGNVAKKERQKLANSWLVAVAESFGRRRLSLASIDEPCETWLKDLIKWLETVATAK